MRPRTVLFIANLLFSILSALAAYILLPYLATLMPAVYTGLVVALGGCVALALFPFMPKLANRYGAQRLALCFSLTEMIVLLILAAAPSIFSSILLIIVMVALQPFLAYQLDLLLEATGNAEGTVGRVRALFLTAWNMGSFVAPLLIGVLLANSDTYGRVFIAAAATMLPFAVLFATRHLPGNAASLPSRMRDTLVCIVQHRDTIAVTYAHLILWLFYVWAPLYVPIYLHDVLGIAWSNLGWIFSIMLIPYVLIEYPAGWIADRYLGDKELMFVGFLIAGCALASISLLTATSSLFLILAILIVSRCGAALIEAMTEGHFFRSVTEHDVNSVSIFRAVWPLANVIAPIVGSIILFFGNYQFLFLFTGSFVALAGAIATMCIIDFK
jgi:MFS family permease